MTASVPLGTPALCTDPAFCSWTCAPSSRADGLHVFVSTVSTVSESMVCCVSSRSTGPPDRVPRSDIDVEDTWPAVLAALFRGSSSADSRETTAEAVGVVIVPIVLAIEINDENGRCFAGFMIPEKEKKKQREKGGEGAAASALLGDGLGT